MCIQQELKWSHTGKSLSIDSCESKVINDNPNTWNFNLNNNNSNSNWNNNVNNENHLLLFQHFNPLEKISYLELMLAYRKCRKTKRWRDSATFFELDKERNLKDLLQLYKDGSYKLSPASIFVISDPKYREIFAAKFRDRILHHIFISRLKPYFLEYFSPYTFNCIEGRGSLKAIKLLQEYLLPGYYVLGLDIKACFPSIPIKYIRHDLSRFIDIIDVKDKDLLKYILNLLLDNRQSNNYIKMGTEEEWSHISKEKSLIGRTDGLPIGDLTSQYLVNFMLTRVDNYLTNHGYKFVRFVDDFRIIVKKQDISTLKHNLFEYIEDLGLQFNKDKIYIQPCEKGCPFIGFFVTNRYILPGKRLKNSIYEFILHLNVGYIDGAIYKYVSYMGFLSHCRAFKISSKLEQAFIKYNSIYTKNGRVID